MILPNGELCVQCRTDGLVKVGIATVRINLYEIENVSVYIILESKAIIWLAFLSNNFTNYLILDDFIECRGT